ncbi:MAG: CheR family methyltransferase [Coleofasciculaceae cyanobacterium]
MAQEDVEVWLRKKIGLEPNSIGSNQIARALRKRFLASGLADMHSYLRKLRTSIQEQEELIENIVVQETWFFRDRHPFNFLARHVSSEWLPNQPHSVLRVISVPCATGEEPYSIAMTLLEAGLKPNQFQINAADISKQAILKAKAAVYGKNSFRGENLDFQKKYFQPTADGFRLCELVRNSVNFRQGNVLEPLFLSAQKPMHIIFCRNLLIYLEASARLSILEVLERSLINSGLLFVGSAEAGQITSNQLVSVRFPLSFAYRKVGKRKEKLNLEINQSITAPAVPQSRKLPRATTAQQRCTAQKNPQLLPASLQTSKEHIQGKQEQDSLLETARNLANQGNLPEAVTLCKTYLQSNRTSAKAYVLLGEVHQGLDNNKEAENCYQKAIYLEPNYYEALVHMALLKENSGDLEGAAIIRARIQRLPKQE